MDLQWEEISQFSSQAGEDLEESFGWWIELLIRNGGGNRWRSQHRT